MVIPFVVTAGLLKISGGARGLVQATRGRVVLNLCSWSTLLLPLSFRIKSGATCFDVLEPEVGLVDNSASASKSGLCARD
jgi:hypothetical protein